MSKAQKKKKNKKQIFRLVVLEEHSYEPLFGFRLSVLNMLFYFGGIFVIILLLSYLLFRYTPLSTFFPSSEDLSLQNELIENRRMLDSLGEQVKIMDDYFTKLKMIITGKKLDSMAVMDSSYISEFMLSKQEHDSILKSLQQFDINYQDITEIDVSQQTEISDLKFVKPVDGVVSNNFNPSAGHFGIDIVAPAKTPVVSVLPGTVIFANWTLNAGYVIEIQHSNNIISIYKHNSELLKKEGDRVQAGDAIAIVGNTGEVSTGPHIHFELWINGVPVDPKKYIVF